MAEERTLDWVIGKDKDKKDVSYKTTFFEWHLENALMLHKFGHGSLNLVNNKIIKLVNFDPVGLIRYSNTALDGTICKYTRNPQSKIYIPEEMNDYKKILERAEFSNGYNSIFLQRDTYKIKVKSVFDDKRVDKAIENAFAVFNRNILKGKPLERRKTENNSWELDYGSKEDKLDLLYEFIFQYDILYYLLHPKL